MYLMYYLDDDEKRVYTLEVSTVCLPEASQTQWLSLQNARADASSRKDHGPAALSTTV